MHRYIIEDTRYIAPFNEPASLLTIGTKPLKLHHEDLFLDYFGQQLELGGIFESVEGLHTIDRPAIVYRDSLWFDEEFLADFMTQARQTGRACQAAIPADDSAFSTYTLPLSNGFRCVVAPDGTNICLVDLWYFPDGFSERVMPIVVPGEAIEKGFYSVPDFMTNEQGDLTHYLPARAVLSIESWVHVYYASIIFGVFTRGSRREEYIANHNFYALRLLWRALLEQKQVLSTSALVRVGKNTVIHPSARISGPTTIGDNCSIGPGVVIDNCSIGDNVSIDQGCQLMLSTVANNCFLPFRASLYLTAVMESTIIAQNTCLQMCVVGRNSFIGAGNTFTDFMLLGEAVSGADGLPTVQPRSVKAVDIDGNIRVVGQVVLGSAVGHNCRIGSGLVFMPGRMVESDVVLIASPQRRVVSRSVTFEESDHHYVGGMAEAHRRRYPRKEERAVPEEDLKWNTW